MTNHDSERRQAVVYFARAGDYVKIGTTRDDIRIRIVGVRCDARNAAIKAPDDLPDERLQLLGTIPGGRSREIDIHADLWEWREAGEWFAATEPVLAFIDDLLEREGLAA